MWQPGKLQQNDNSSCCCVAFTEAHGANSDGLRQVLAAKNRTDDDVTASDVQTATRSHLSKRFVFSIYQVVQTKQASAFHTFIT